MEYANKVALVTGANSGIGEAIAHRLAALGCKVYVNGRREAENQPEDIAATVTHLLELSPAAWPTEIVIPRRGSD